MALRGVFSTKPLARIEMKALPLAKVSMDSSPLAALRISTAALASVAVPVFPATIVEAGLQGVDGFLLGADGTILQGADL